LHSWPVCTMLTMKWRWQCWKWHDSWISCKEWGICGGNEHNTQQVKFKISWN
jgi:hypothetical protein